MKDITQNWLKVAKNDLKVAEDNFKIANYLNCIEKCHAALEKLLKGIIAESNQTPPKVHNLLKLASVAVIENLQKDLRALFDELSDCYISLRYPDNFDEIEGKYNKDETSRVLKATKGVFSWLKEKIEQN